MEKERRKITTRKRSLDISDVCVFKIQRVGITKEKTKEFRWEVLPTVLSQLDCLFFQLETTIFRWCDLKIKDSK